MARRKGKKTIFVEGVRDGMLSASLSSHYPPAQQEAEQSERINAMAKAVAEKEWRRSNGNYGRLMAYPMGFAIGEDSWKPTNRWM